jgi:hypothetical protein
MKSRWTIFSSIATLCALCLSTAVVYSFFLSSNYAKNEQVMADESVSGETAADLRVKLYETGIRLKEVRKELKEVQIKLAESLSLQKMQELKVAEIISGEQDGARINEALLKDIKNSQVKSVQASRQFEELCELVESLLKLHKADEAVEEKFKAKAALVREKLAGLLVAGSMQNRLNGMILDVNKELEVVAVNIGYGDGVTQGSEWQVIEDSRKIASLKIIEVRRSLSLGVLTEGKLQDVLQGATVEKIIKFVK